MPGGLKLSWSPLLGSCVSPTVVSVVLERSAHMGGGGGKERGRGRRPCGWAGTVPYLLSESDSDPFLAPACSGSASCSFGSWRLGWLFSPRTEAREEGCWCPSPSTGVGEKEVEIGCWVLSALPVIPPGYPKFCPVCIQQDTRHTGQMTKWCTTCIESFPEKLPLKTGSAGQMLVEHHSDYLWVVTWPKFVQHKTFV